MNENLTDEYVSYYNPDRGDCDLTFKNCANLKTVWVTGFVKNIYFEDCPALEIIEGSTEIPVSLSLVRSRPPLISTQVCSLSFDHCDLTDVTLPLSVTNLTIHDCQGYDKIRIPEYVKTISLKNCELPVETLPKVLTELILDNAIIRGDLSHIYTANLLIKNMPYFQLTTCSVEDILLENVETLVIERMPMCSRSVSIVNVNDLKLTTGKETNLRFLSLNKVKNADVELCGFISSIMADECAFTKFKMLGLYEHRDVSDKCTGDDVVAFRVTGPLSGKRLPWDDAVIRQ
jgi:hypothetical protein